MGRFLVRRSRWSIEEMRARLRENQLTTEALRETSEDMIIAKRGVRAAFEISWEELEKIE